MDLKLPKMLCKDSKQHHVMFHELNSVSSLLCIAQNVRFEIPYKVLYFETPFLMIFKYYAWASYVLTTLKKYQQFSRVRAMTLENLHFAKRIKKTLVKWKRPLLLLNIFKIFFIHVLWLFVFSFVLCYIC